MRLREDGGRGALWVALAYRPAIGPSVLLPNSPDLALPHLSRSDVPFCQQLICSPALLYLSPFTLCFPFTSCSVGLEEIYTWVWSLFTVVYMRLIMDHRALLSATFFFFPPWAWWVSCWPSHYYASAVQQCSLSAPDWPFTDPPHT